VTETLPYRLGVGVMLINAANRVFVGQRIDWPGHAWQMPQGGVDKGEAWEAAAFRELEEETGVRAHRAELITRTAEPLAYDLPADIRSRIWKGRYRGQQQHWFLMRFTGTDSDIDIATAHPEFGQWQWAEIDQLVEMIVPFKRDLYTAVIAQFRPHLQV
jgi:putative (di)nucleoside polyphosphate hydrolase